MKNKYIIGIDYGTLSARAVVVSIEDGAVKGEYVVTYPHGVITGALPDGTRIPDSYALASAKDYRDALCESIQGVMAVSGVSGEDVEAIGIDATTYTMIPCLEDGRAISELKEYESEPMAYVKLWKHQGAAREAMAIEKAYTKKGAFPVLSRYGGRCNCEFALPKLLEVYEKAPEVFEKVYRFCDLGEYLAWLLTGKIKCSCFSAGFKAMWAEDLGWPGHEELENLSAGFGDAFYAKFAGPIQGFDSPWGELKKEMAEILGLRPGIKVASPMGDGSIPGMYFGLKEPHAAVISLGTSIGIAFTSQEKHEITGINGVTLGGIIPGRWSYDAGTPCAGDMLDWMCKNIIPASVSEEAEKRGQDLHGYLSGKVQQPWNNKLTVLDWWNGNRSILSDMSLRGSILGLSMSSAPEDLYCAFIQSIACSLRVILEHFRENGIQIDKVILCGGIPRKNRFLVSEIAEILGTDVYISKEKHLTAISAAVLGAMSLSDKTERETIISKMIHPEYDIVVPKRTYKDQYEKIFCRFRYYHDLLSHFSQ